MAFRDAVKDLQEFDINSIELETIGTWPILVKSIVWAIVLIGCLVAGYVYVVSPKMEQLDKVVQQETKLRQEFETKAKKAANLPAYRKQLAEMEETFGALLKQLPTDTEVPGLLEDITEKGVSNGLQISSITLQKEVAREFYVELPISIKVVGPYHDLAAFVSGIAGLPRIVTLHDFKIAAGKGVDLSMSITAKTYRYRDTEADK